MGYRKLTVYEKMDLLVEASNEIRADIAKRLVLDNPDMVDKAENNWLYDIMSNLPNKFVIDQLKEKLNMYDLTKKYGDK